jgi:molybdopterin synthase sulfur carrier subunit
MNKSITITIQLLAQYRENRFKVEERVYSSGTTVEDIIDELGISEYEFPLGILMVNSKHEKEEYILQEGDILVLSPTIAGG